MNLFAGSAEIAGREILALQRRRRHFDGLQQSRRKDEIGVVLGILEIDDQGRVVI